MDQVNSSDHDLLIELRTEMRGVRNDIQRLNNDTISQVKDLQSTKLDKEEFDRAMIDAEKKHESFVTRDEFEPIKKLAYGAMTLVLGTVGAALLYLVINQQGSDAKTSTITPSLAQKVEPISGITQQILGVSK